MLSIGYVFSTFALGPDLPRADQLYPGETFGYSAKRHSHLFLAISFGITLLLPSTLLAVQLSAGNMLLTKNALFGVFFPGFGGVFQPGTIFGAGLLDYELLRHSLNGWWLF